jgi:hypothetical protein
MGTEIWQLIGLVAALGGICWLADRLGWWQ